MSKTITFTATFSGGAGTVNFTGIEGIPGGIKTLTCDKANPASVQSFDAVQSGGHHSAGLGGAAPDGGSLTVDIKDGNSSLASDTYPSGLFAGKSLDYDVQDDSDSLTTSLLLENTKEGIQHIHIGKDSKHALVTVSVPPGGKINLSITHES